MAKIIDSDSLVRSSTQGNLGTDGNIWIDSSYRMISLASYGDLSDDGVTIQAIYSYLKEEWKTDTDLIKFPFPMVAITPEQFEFVDSWQPSSMDTVYLFKDGGFAIKDNAGASTSEFAGIITLGSLGATDQVYYQQVEDGVAIDIHLTGAVNQCVKTYGIVSGSNISFDPDQVASAQNDLGPNASEEIDCSTSYHLTITVDSEGPTEVNIQGATPAATTYTEVIAAINAAFTGTPAVKSGTGVDARIVISGTATTNGNFVIVADGTTTTGTMALFTSRDESMVAEAGDQITSTSMITTFHEGDVITVAGSTNNNNTFVISSISSDYLRMTTEATDPALITEAAGASITITADARDYFKIFAREYAKLYAQSELNDIGVSAFTYQAYRFPLANADDLKITHTDAVVGGNAITNASGDGSEITFTSSSHGLSVGSAITVSGMNPSGYDGDYTVTGVADVNTFTVAGTETGAFVSGGTVIGQVYDDMDITYLDGSGFTAYADATTYAANTAVQDVGDSMSNGYDAWYITALGGTSSGGDLSSDTGITDWTSYSGERQIGSAYYPFKIIIDADVADDGGLPTAEEIYEFIQYSLRQNEDIDAGSGTVIGKTANVLLNFVGDTLVTEQCVFIDDFSDTDINGIEFYDCNGVKRTFPFVAAGSILFNDNLVSDGGAVYKMFFTNNDAGDDDGSDFGTSNAIIVQDNDGTDISGAVPGTETQFTYDYDGNVQRGTGSNATDAPVTVVAIGLTRAQYVKTTGTIGRSNANTFSLVASLERNYSNPA